MNIRIMLPASLKTSSYADRKLDIAAPIEKSQQRINPIGSSRGKSGTRCGTQANANCVADDKDGNRADECCEKKTKPKIFHFATGVTL